MTTLVTGATGFVGINIVEARCIVSHPMVKNRFVVEVGDTQALKGAINRLRSIDAVFDAYRVTPRVHALAGRDAVGVDAALHARAALAGPRSRVAAPGSRYAEAESCGVAAGAADGP